MFVGSFFEAQLSDVPNSPKFSVFSKLSLLILRFFQKKREICFKEGDGYVLCAVELLAHKYAYVFF